VCCSEAVQVVARRVLVLPAGVQGIYFEALSLQKSIVPPAYSFFRGARVVSYLLTSLNVFSDQAGIPGPCSVVLQETYCLLQHYKHPALLLHSFFLWVVEVRDQPLLLCDSGHC